LWLGDLVVKREGNHQDTKAPRESIPKEIEKEKAAA
jgi:hypothetical protein